MKNSATIAQEKSTIETTVENVETAKTAKASKTAKTAKAPKAPKIVEAKKEDVLEASPVKEKTPRISKIERVQNEICKQFEITEVQFWKFMANHKPGKMNNNKFADSLVQKAFFDREKLAEQLKG